jgi:hypothetical protein
MGQCQQPAKSRHSNGHADSQLRGQLGHIRTGHRRDLPDNTLPNYKCCSVWRLIDQRGGGAASAIFKFPKKSIQGMVFSQSDGNQINKGSIVDPCDEHFLLSTTNKGVLP